MSLKLLRSTLCLLAMSPLFTDGAIAQPADASTPAAAKAKFANDYNAGKWRDVIADADMLKKAGALDAQAQLVIGQAYYKAGDYAGCAKYVRETFGAAPSEDPLELLNHCETLAAGPQP